MFVGQSQQRPSVFALQHKRQIIFAFIESHVDASPESLIFFLDDALNELFHGFNHNHLLEDDHIVIEEGAVCIVLEDLKVVDLEIEVDDGSLEFVGFDDRLRQHFLSWQANEDDRRRNGTDCLCYFILVDNSTLTITALDKDLFF